MKQIKISEKLVKDSVFNPTKNTRQETIEQMCIAIQRKTLCLPLYQRDVSWTLEKSVALFNYQLSGKAPVAPISMNEIDGCDDNVKHIEFISREEITGITPKYSVVDGQQRLTTNYKAYINDPEFSNIVLDLTKGIFLECKDSIKENQIPVGILFNKDIEVFRKYINSHKTLKDDFVKDVLNAVRQKIFTYFYTINSATNLTEDEQIEWFEVLNNAGSKVSALQLKFSKFKSSGLDVYTEFTAKFLEKLKYSGFDIKFKQKKSETSSPIAAINPIWEKTMKKYHTGNNFAPIPSDIKKDSIKKLQEEKLNMFFTETLDKLDKVIEFIDGYKLKKQEKIDYINYLIGYFTFIDSPDYEYLINWYNKIDFTNLTNSERRVAYTKLLDGTAFVDEEL